MPDYFFDTSTLVKRYLMEVGSPRVLQLMDPAMSNHLWISRLAHVELVAAITRRVRMGQVAQYDAEAILTMFDHDRAGVYRTVEVPIVLIERAMTLARQYQLRGYDAVQLACFEELAQTLVPFRATAALICADGELSAAGRQMGLVVESP